MPSKANPVTTWNEYFAATLPMPLHPIYDQIDGWLPQSGKALELGAGVGHGVLHLLEKGLEVTAVDAEPEAVRILRQRAPSATVIESRFEEMDLAQTAYDVVVAGFSLFFLSKSEFVQFWPRLVASIKPNGIFAGQFLGLQDNWASQGYLAHAEQEIRQVLSSFEILFWEEAERDGKTSPGTLKHWHVYHVVARLKGLEG
jgi:SAM-dependent methyltransferase